MSSADIRIVRLTSLPEAPLAELVRESEASGFALLRRLRDDWLSGANRFDRPGESLFGAFTRDELVGVCGVNIDPFTKNVEVSRLRHLYVKISHRRLGVGRQIVAHACRSAGAHFRRIQLRTHSAEASRFYEQLGFVPEYAVPTVTHARELAGSSGPRWLR